ncbi:DUF2946 domain-containing protein [Shewanella sp. KJ2020]|uniref:DUF2946 domain-containing protein n=1 Tax=Shewanella sp. KJ2020 TaxID=2919172 RepID=UPI0020A70BC8|nr:DUF2946 domain-containing protein [Shewanella sp. KJ2020]MCP3129963.1 DUF2946 domain-containing protein [Shewanella sp. KJ2020]
MSSVVQTRRRLALWLAAILVLLSVAFAVHSVSHANDDTKAHCSLCLHQHQLQYALTSTPFHFQLAQQCYICVEFQAISFKRPCCRYFNSRAPPITA